MITDLNGRNAEILKKKKLWLLDMDGTIYNENEIFEGTLDFLQQIRDNGGRYIFITNNSSKSVTDYVQKAWAFRRVSKISTPPARLPPCISGKIIPARRYIAWEPGLW